MQLARLNHGSSLGTSIGKAYTAETFSSYRPILAMTDSQNRAEFTSDSLGKTAICGAKTHNLKNIDLEIPHGKMTVITGMSGSGKSSLVFDTLFAEGQRQYLNSLSNPTRRLVDVLPRPNVDSISGLQPTLCIDQKSASVHPRSTVATLAEIYDFLRLLMARAGTPFCHQCKALIQQQSPTEIIQDILSQPNGSKITLLAPVVRGRKGSHRDVFDTLRKAGLVKARVDGETIELETSPSLDPNRSHTVEAICDRIILREGAEPRIEAAVQVALKLASGLVSVLVSPPTSQVLNSDGNAKRAASPSNHPHGSGAGAEGSYDAFEKLYSTKYACPDCGLSYEEIEPRIFSFNSPYGACDACKGLGQKRGQDSFSAPVPNPLVCPACNGTRLRPEPRSIFWNGLSIDQICAFTIEEALDWFLQLDPRRDQDSFSLRIGRPIIVEIAKRLQFLKRIGLGYLTLSRSSETLSGGELQRVRLGTSLGTGLIGVCYILDEPSLGLHPSDSQQLIGILHELRDQGNTLVIVEHDHQIMLAADLLIDFGPGAGPHGGAIIASGTPRSVMDNPDSVTGPFLKKETLLLSEISRRESIALNSQDAISAPMRHDSFSASGRPHLRVLGAHLHNLRSIDVEIPLQCFVTVTGVSGSGKSTLIFDTLVPAIQDYFQQQKRGVPHGPLVGPFKAVENLSQIDKLIVVDQQPIGRNARSTPSTYLGIWELVREVFAQTRESKQRGFTAGRFGFNSAAGRCEACQGQGQRTISMGFMADVYESCPRCAGMRFNRPTLAVRYKDKSIGDILSMTVDEAHDFFQNFAKVARILETLRQVGLGYLTLGQPSQTLSGGEAQRIKIAAELARPDTQKTLYVLDEPTSGLHARDVENLIHALRRLIDRGNSVVVTEHHLEVIRRSDWQIDLGPAGGPRGGQLLFAGHPERRNRA
jgi:excinuclease ABC subunit A